MRWTLLTVALGASAKRSADAFERSVARQCWASGARLIPCHRPVLEELQELELPLEGSLPAALNGLFIRNGPNPAQPVIGKYHWCAQKLGKVPLLTIGCPITSLELAVRWCPWPVHPRGAGAVARSAAAS